MGGCTVQAPGSMAEMTATTSGWRIGAEDTRAGPRPGTVRVGAATAALARIARGR
jgi:hypothetical protein